ncbi:hypothetical protein Godav_005826, partial [Gossypium davidsonii]|nr:hypothetical protein [Gossypium davidsonii]
MCGSVSHRNSGFHRRWVPTPLVGAVRKNGGPKGYKFGDRLQSLLEVSGSRVNYVEEICSSSQNINTVITPRIKELKHRSPLAEAFGCGENTCLTYVIPGRSVDKFDHLDNLGLSYRVDEMALIRALLSGKLDQSILISSS